MDGYVGTTHTHSISLMDAHSHTLALTCTLSIILSSIYAGIEVIVLLIACSALSCWWPSEVLLDEKAGFAGEVLMVLLLGGGPK